MKKISIYSIILVLAVLLTSYLSLLTQTSFAIAAEVETYSAKGLIPCGRLSNPCQFKHIFILLHNIMDLFMFKLGPVFATLMVVYGGFKIMVSAQSPGSYYRGREIIKWALLGYGLMLLSWVIVNTVLLYLGLAQWTNFKDWWNIDI